MNKHVPAEYTVEFGQKVADSFVWLGGFVDKTEFRLDHLERHLGEVADAVVKLEEVSAITAKQALRQAKKFPLKTLFIFYGGVIVGSKLRDRVVRDRLKKAYTDAASKVEKVVSENLDNLEKKDAPEKDATR